MSSERLEADSAASAAVNKLRNSNDDMSMFDIQAEFLRVIEPFKSRSWYECVLGRVSAAYESRLSELWNS